MQSIVLKFDLANIANASHDLLCFLVAKEKSQEGQASLATDQKTGERFIYERPYGDIDTVRGIRLLWPRFSLGETIFVKETWGYNAETLAEAGEIKYWSSTAERPISGWKAPVSMNMSEARTFFTVLNITPMLIQEITPEQALLAGIEKTGKGYINYMHPSCFENSPKMRRRAELWPHKEKYYSSARDSFASMWEAHTRHDMIEKNGWFANPCVWMIALRHTSPEQL